MWFYLPTNDMFAKIRLHLAVKNEIVLCILDSNWKGVC